MKIGYVVSLALAFLAGACSKSDTPPSAPSESAPGVVSRIYVNPASGSDGNPGTDAAPLKTINKALSLAQAGQRVDLQAGTYDAASGQTYPDTIPTGVTVEAVSAGLAVLVGGSGDVAFAATGNDTTRYLALRGFRSVLQTASGIHVELSMSVDNIIGDAFDLSSNAQVVMTGCTLTNSGVASMTDIARLTLNATAISGQPNSEYIILVKAATLLMNGSSMSDAKTTGVDMRDVSVATLIGCSISKVSYQGAGGSSSVDMSGSSSLTLRSTNVSGAYGPVVLMRDPGTSVTVRSCNFSGNGTGSGYPELWQEAGNLDIDSSYIYGATSSGFVFQGGSLSIRNTTVQSMSEAGISAANGTSLILRNTTISSCKWGILLNGPGGSADLGSASSPGGNTFTNNSICGIRVSYSGGLTVLAVGNVWVPNMEGANANGQYASALVTGPVNVASPTNYTIDSNGGKIQF